MNCIPFKNKLLRTNYGQNPTLNLLQSVRARWANRRSATQINRARRIEKIDERYAAVKPNVK
ncbi:MAG TPA: hypothetical protein DCS07_01430 [Bdellovibrionales bacterium]|nr:MAG: hypothetical protein A2X97_08030 [Bdellovibrionales bacterium GWA1_52_35]OFZ40511.1 MAG: hypothetical protein A2070_09100 [Bdellovibrionales bacterium GWC1_52_8]HAR41286.1 hypothetical protein [Bdellovibrionales bacterium]HCM41447.1 hypothetical protein [Bdellovibrionales bacterium]